MDIIFNMKCVISMKQFTFSLIIFVTIVSDLFSNIIEQNLDKLKFYHHKLIAGGQMEVTIYRGELNKSEADSLLKSFSEMPLAYDMSDRKRIISNIESLLKKENSFMKKDIRHLYSPSGYKCTLLQSLYGINGSINDKNNLITSKSKGLLYHYDTNKNTLSIYEAPAADWNSPTYFNFIIINPMMLDFNKLISNNANPKQILSILPDGENAVFIEGCINSCERIHIIIRNGFPCMDTSIYYKSSKERTILRNIFYRFYKNIDNLDSNLEYPSLVLVIDSPQNSGLYKVELYEIIAFKLLKVNDDEFDIRIKKDTKILTNMN